MVGVGPQLLDLAAQRLGDCLLGLKVGNKSTIYDEGNYGLPFAYTLREPRLPTALGDHDALEWGNGLHGKKPTLPDGPLSSGLAKSFMQGMATKTMEDFGARTKRLAAERGISLNQLGNLAWATDIPGTSPDSFKKARRGEVRPNRALIEGVAGVLRVEPTEFPEYRLALMRQILDEREVGLDVAMKNHETIEGALSEPALMGLGLVAAPAAQGDQPSSSSKTVGGSKQ
jgi:hypothetical protein